MKSIRISAWSHEAGGVFMASEAKSHAPPAPSWFTNYLLSGNGQTCSVDVFPAQRGHPAIAFIPPDAPAWADGALERIFDDEGRKRVGYWKGEGEE